MLMLEQFNPLMLIKNMASNTNVDHNQLVKLYNLKMFPFQK